MSKFVADEFVAALQKYAGADFECEAAPLGVKYRDVFHQTLTHFNTKNTVLLLAIKTGKGLMNNP